jgi:DNA repair exonuclease SbcCD nuclease subunit
VKSYDLDLSLKEREKAAQIGRKELRKHLLDLYHGKLPTITDLHDYPLYNRDSGKLFQDFEKYLIMYPGVNKNLARILEEFKGLHKKKSEIQVKPDFRSVFSAYHQFDFEFYPVRIKEDGSFETMMVEDAEKMVREVVEFVQQNS